MYDCRFPNDTGEKEFVTGRLKSSRRICSHIRIKTRVIRSPKILLGASEGALSKVKLHINHVKFLGYDKDVNGNLIINTKQAKIVRRIYREFLDGKGANSIAKELEHDGVLNWNGKIKFSNN